MHFRALSPQCMLRARAPALPVKRCKAYLYEKKIYKKLLDWKEKRQGEVALLVEGARRIGKSYIVEEFGRNE